jgi:hypothetical protein
MHGLCGLCGPRNDSQLAPLWRLPMKYSVYTMYDNTSLVPGTHRQFDLVEDARKFFSGLINYYSAKRIKDFDGTEITYGPYNIRVVFKYGSKVLAVHQCDSLPWDENNWLGRVDQIGEHRKPGRPASADVMVNLSVRVSVGDADTIRRVGGGNASEGVRRLVKRWGTK